MHLPITLTHRLWSSLRQAGFLLIALCCAVCLSAQVEDPAGEILENYFRDSEQASESDAQQWLENLELLRSNPLDLNRATREDLLALHLLNDLQIEHFLNYRDSIGNLLNTYELQAVPGLELSDIRRLLPFIRVSSGIDTRNSRIFNGFTRGENEALLRWSQTEPPPYDNKKVEGGPYSLALRYRHSFDNRLRFGFTAENDPGEALFRNSNREGFDFYSAHLFAQNLNPTLRAVALGDFSARFGQGLLLQTGFSPGKSAESIALLRGGRKLAPYASFGETYFFRGGATTLQLGKRWQFTALFSSRGRDGNIDSTALGLQEAEQIFTSLQTSGLHRDSGEIADERAIREMAAGLSATYSWRAGEISVNALHLNYDKPWQPSYEAYRQFNFQGKDLTGVSVDYLWRRRNWIFFGETAGSDNGAVATLNGLLLSADRRVTLAALHRALPRDYQSVYAAPFLESSSAANEQGLYLGAEIKPAKAWQINVYADHWRHPWLRSNVDAPSYGRGYLARVMWTRRRVMSVYLLWQSETKQSNAPSEIEALGLYDNQLMRFRLHAGYKVGPSLELRSRVEWTTAKNEILPLSRGYMAYQEAVFKKLGFPLSGALRYGLFDTKDYDSRIYTFENDLFSAISIPAFAGRGSRLYLNLTWRVNKVLRLEARVEQTNVRRASGQEGQLLEPYQRELAASTAKPGERTVWKLQARVNW